MTHHESFAIKVLESIQEKIGELAKNTKQKEKQNKKTILFSFYFIFNFDNIMPRKYFMDFYRFGKHQVVNIDVHSK